MESSSNETKSPEFYIVNEDTLISPKEIQQQIMIFDNSLKTI